MAKRSNKKANGGYNRPKPMSPRAGTTKTKRRYSEGGKIKNG